MSDEPIYRIPDHLRRATTPRSTCHRMGRKEKIVFNNRSLKGLLLDTYTALEWANNPPRDFLLGGQMVRVQNNGSVLPYNKAELRERLAEVAHWTKQTSNGEQPDFPPDKLINHILETRSNRPPFPRLSSVLRVPYFAADGRLVLTPGYDDRTRVYLHAGNLKLSAVPDVPSAAEMRRARELLLDELLGEFNFADDASRATIIAALLLPFVRLMLDEREGGNSDLDASTPLHVLDGEVPSAGKGLLGRIISRIIQNKPAQLFPWADNREFRSQVTAVLLAGQEIILIDNVARRVDSAVLASALTASLWQDRKHYTHEMLSLRNRGLWLLTGNEIGMSAELARRSAYCRLKAPKKSFEQEHLERWGVEHRSELIWALLLLARNWIANNRPAGSFAMPSFVSWSRTMSGILDAAGIPGLGDNFTAWIETAVPCDPGELRRLFDEWWKIFGGEAVTVQNLEGQVPYPSSVVKGTKTVGGKNGKLSDMLLKLNRKWFGPYRVADTGQRDQDKRFKFRLERR